MSHIRISITLSVCVWFMGDLVYIYTIPVILKLDPVKSGSIPSFLSVRYWTVPMLAQCSAIVKDVGPTIIGSIRPRILETWGNALTLPAKLFRIVSNIIHYNKLIVCNNLQFRTDNASRIDLPVYLVIFIQGPIYTTRHLFTREISRYGILAL